MTPPSRHLFRLVCRRCWASAMMTVTVHYRPHTCPSTPDDELILSCTLDPTDRVTAHLFAEAHQGPFVKLPA